MAIPTEQQVQISGTPTEGNELIQNQWVESGIDITLTEGGIEVTNGKVYLTDGSAHNIGDGSCAVDSPDTSNSIFLINRKSKYYLGFSTDGSLPDYPYVKIAEVEPNADILTTFNEQKPPISSSKIDADSLALGGGEAATELGGGGFDPEPWELVIDDPPIEYQYTNDSGELKQVKVMFEVAEGASLALMDVQEGLDYGTFQLSGTGDSAISTHLTAFVPDGGKFSIMSMSETDPDPKGVFERSV